MMSLENSFKHTSLTQCLEQIDHQRMFWIAKRLSGNDTGLNGAHQAGVYFPKEFFQQAFPELATTRVKNPDTKIDYCYFPNIDEKVENLRVVYYNNRFFAGTRNEFRITNWGGRKSPTNDPESTGAIFLFALKKEGDSFVSIGWVASSLAEEDLIESWLGNEIEPGEFYMPHQGVEDKREFEIPDAWFKEFPAGREIFDYIVELLPREKWKGSIDKLLLKRREIEFSIYRRIENESVLPVIKKGFNSVDDFIRYAHSVSNRRKSRTGRSLELNLETIFRDEKLYFEAQAVTENRKRPDFLFPSSKAYQDPLFPDSYLRLVAAKTTCKDRWRQVIDEAKRIEVKHLFTLQQGISTAQLKQMHESKVHLVVPEPYLSTYPSEWRAKILTLEELTKMIRYEQAMIKDIKQWVV